MGGQMMGAAIAEPAPKRAVAEAPYGRIDTHVHFRNDGKPGEPQKYTIEEGKALSRKQGIVAVCDMPNTNPPILRRKDVEARLALAEKEGCSEGYYLFMGLTTDLEQIAEAVEVYRENPKVVGFKLYAGKSTGNLGVLSKAEQSDVFKKLVELGYEGTVVVHCESALLENADLWNPKEPQSWNEAKPPGAEVKAIWDIIEIATNVGFKGHVHIAHVSTPFGAILVDGMSTVMHISCEFTPHHLMLSTEDMKPKEGDMTDKERYAGIRYKVNPPLREPQMVEELRQQFKELVRKGRKCWIATDHAPHFDWQKEYSPERKPEEYASGIRSLENYSALIEKLREWGFTEKEIRAVTRDNIKKVLTKIRE